MNIFALVYTIIAIVLLLAVIAVVIWKQIKLSSSAVYFFLFLLIAILIWVIGDLLQNIFSYPNNIADAGIVLVFSRIATISSMIAMMCAILFSRVLSSKNTLDSITVAISAILFGGVVAQTLGSSYHLRDTKSELGIYVSSTDLVWIIFNVSLVLIAGTIFLRYFLRQRNIVERRNKKYINLTIIGVIIGFYLGVIFYFLHAMVVWFDSVDQSFVKPIIHLEALVAAIGACIIAIGMLIGGNQVVYYTSRLYSLHIFDTKGVNLYSCVFQSGHSIDEHLMTGVATAISNFAKELIGQDVFPEDVDFGNYSLLLGKKGDHVCMISAEKPTQHLKQCLWNIIDNFDEKQSMEELSDTIEFYLSFQPRIMISEEV